VLPDEHQARKRAKPDLEWLAALPGGRLLTVGSGSRPSRTRGALVDRATRAVTPVDAAPLYAALTRELSELNLEGAAIAGAHLRLLQRGNGPSGVNAVVDLALAGVLEALAAGRALGPELLERVTRVDVGSLPGGERLDFTDCSPLPDGRLVFTCAAEAGASTYDDGPCAGAAVGILEAEARVSALWPVTVAAGPLPKLEGIHVGADGHTLLLVADGDQRGRPAPLYAGDLP